jgi:hypothetical protein
LIRDVNQTIGNWDLSSFPYFNKDGNPLHKVSHLQPKCWDILRVTKGLKCLLVSQPSTKYFLKGPYSLKNVISFFVFYIHFWLQNITLVFCFVFKYLYRKQWKQCVSFIIESKNKKWNHTFSQTKQLLTIPNLRIIFQAWEIFIYWLKFDVSVYLNDSSNVII